MIGIIDTEAKNIGSLQNCLKFLGKKTTIINNIKSLKKVDKIILPGVGSFDTIMKSLKKKGFYGDKFKKDLKKKKLVLGICVGMQVLFECSEEGKLPGLNIFKGRFKNISKLSKKKIKVPHVGFNEVKSESLNKHDYYFIHSYALKIDKANTFDEIGTTKYEDFNFISYLKKDNIVAVQFHPEKSGVTGLNFLDKIC